MVGARVNPALAFRMMYPESCHNSQSIQTIDGLTKLRGVIKIPAS